MGGHRIIFLDTNGVLNFSKHRLEELRKGRSIACENMRLNSIALDLLGKLVRDTNSKVVITSSWRKHKHDGQFNNLKKQLKDRAGIDIFDTTPILGKHIDKGIEIQEWFKQNQHLDIEGFVVIDDEHIEGYSENTVLCDRDTGFTRNDLYNKAYDIVNSLIEEQVAEN